MKFSNQFNLTGLKPSFAIILFLFITFNLNAQNNKHPFGGKLVLSLNGGLSVLGVHDYDNIPNYNASGAIEYLFSKTSLSTVGIKLFARKGFVSGEYDTYPVPSRPDLYPPEFETEFTSFGGGVTYQYHFNNFFSPYIFGGASYLQFDPKDKNGDLLPANEDDFYDKDGVSFIAEMGLRFFISNSFSINLSGGLNITGSDWLDDVMVGKYQDWIYVGSIGISVGLFGGSNNDKYEKSNYQRKTQTNSTVEKKMEDINKEKKDTQIAPIVVMEKEIKQKKVKTNLSERYPDAKYRLTAEGYAIKVLETTDKAKVENELSWLLDNKFKAFITEVSDSKTGGTKYRLSVGYFKTFDEADNYFYRGN